LNIAKNIKNIAQEVLLNESRAIEILTNLSDNYFEEYVNKTYSSKDQVVITDIGKSVHMANKIVAELSTPGLSTNFAPAATSVTNYPTVTQQEDLVACISKSGNTSEIKVLVPILKRSSMKVVVCNGITKTHSKRLVSQDRKPICCKRLSAHHRFYSQPDLVKERIA
jgi:arabinose-5-phosphate isomerase